MRLNRTALAFFLLTALILVLTSPAAAAGGRACTPAIPVRATRGITRLAQRRRRARRRAYLRYDDAAPPIEPRWDKPNFIFTSKEGTINLWVYSSSKLEGEPWWRDFVVLQAAEDRRDAGQKFILEIYGKCTGKEGLKSSKAPAAPGGAPGRNWGPYSLAPAQGPGQSTSPLGAGLSALLR